MNAGQPIELFVSDIHGEYEEFAHIVRGACGGVRQAIGTLFEGELSLQQMDALATLALYPREKAAAAMEHTEDADAWLAQSFELLARLDAYLADEPCEFGAQTGALACIDDLATLAEHIQYAAVARLHVVGDIYDRGPSPDLVMDELAAYPELDIQWGNHDILWMGAALGQRGCVACVVRISARYGNLSVLEDTYGIDLAPLRAFALKTYGDDPCVAFGIKGNPDLSDEERQATVKIQKAMAYIQFKVDAQLIDENPSFGLSSRKLLHRIDFAAGTVEVDGTSYELLDTVFPTLDPLDPYRLSAEEEAVMDYLVKAFMGCERLQRHIKVLVDRGSLYRIAGDKLLFHACVPLNEDGSLKEVELFGKRYKGRALFDAVDGFVRAAFSETDAAKRKQGLDTLWYLWLGQGSPLFAKSKMATFEIYQIADKAARKEVKNPFYALLQDEDVIDSILEEFGMDPQHARIVCGHVPVKVKDGEDPVKCDGKVLIIDGGMSAPYQASTGVAGFTLVDGVQGLRLATHEHFAGKQAAINEDATLHSQWRRL